MKVFDWVVIRLFQIVVTVFIGYLLLRTATTDVSFDETLVQMAPWTIATVLIAGAALIGLN